LILAKSTTTWSCGCSVSEEASDSKCFMKSNCSYFSAWGSKVCHDRDSGAPCPRSTLKGRRAPRPCWIQLLIPSPRRPRRLKTPTQPRLASSRQCMPSTCQVPIVSPAVLPCCWRAEARPSMPRACESTSPWFSNSETLRSRGERAFGQCRQA